MEKRFERLSIHNKIEILIREMIDKELYFRDAMREFEKIYIETAYKKIQGKQDKDCQSAGDSPQHSE